MNQRTVLSVFTCLLVDCGPPDTPDNGAVVLFNDTLEGSVAVYSCNFAYMLVGDMERICQFSRFTSAMWTGEVPTCIRESKLTALIVLACVDVQ